MFTSGRVRLPSESYRQILVVINKLLIASSIKVQTCFRSMHQVRVYHRQRKCLIKLQAQYRAHRRKQEFRLYKRSATSIAKIFRGCRYRAVLREMLDARVKWRKLSAPLADSLKIGAIARINSRQQSQSVQECSPKALLHALGQVDSGRRDLERRLDWTQQQLLSMESQLTAMRHRNCALELRLLGKERDNRRMNLKLCLLYLGKGAADRHAIKPTAALGMSQRGGGGARDAQVGKMLRKQVQDANTNYLKPNRMGVPGFVGSFGNLNHFNSGLDRFNGHPVINMRPYVQFDFDIEEPFHA